MIFVSEGKDKFLIDVKSQKYQTLVIPNEATFSLAIKRPLLKWLNKNPKYKLELTNLAKLSSDHDHDYIVSINDIQFEMDKDTYEEHDIPSMIKEQNQTQIRTMYYFGENCVFIMAYDGTSRSLFIVKKEGETTKFSSQSLINFIPNFRNIWPEFKWGITITNNTNELVLKRIDISETGKSILIQNKFGEDKFAMTTYKEV